VGGPAGGAVVVFGAGLTPEGKCSQALHDRVRTACLLPQQGYARRVIMSGGPSPYGPHETDAMRDLAVGQGFHLPRIKMAYQRKGLEVCTVPAETTRPLEGLPYFVAREVAGLWYYYFRPMA
jgi:vancomycin permeability regulator SanA